MPTALPAAGWHATDCPPARATHCHPAPGQGPTMAAAPRRRIVLHVGPMKTGSSSIQEWLAESRDRLLAAGIFVPHSLGNNHSPLMGMVIRPDQGPSARLTEAFRAELDAAPPTATQIVISGELLGQGVVSQFELAGAGSALAFRAA